MNAPAVSFSASLVTPAAAPAVTTAATLLLALAAAAFLVLYGEPMPAATATAPSAAPTLVLEKTPCLRSATSSC